SLITHAKPLHGLQLGKIERRDVARLLATITNNVGLTTANRTRAAISALYSWATTQDLTEHNPVMGTKPHAQKARDRVLTPPELVLVWKALPVVDDQYGSILKLCALTGCRREEIGSLRWSEVHGDVIDLPPERTKNKRRHLVPLAAPAKAILDA